MLASDKAWLKQGKRHRCVFTIVYYCRKPPGSYLPSAAAVCTYVGIMSFAIKLVHVSSPPSHVTGLGVRGGELVKLPPLRCAHSVAR